TLCAIDLALRWPGSTARQAGERDDGEDDPGESDAVRNELRGIGNATPHSDQLPADVEDPKVRALVTGERRRQVEPGIFRGPDGNVAVHLVLRNQHVPNISPQRVRLPGLGDERRDEDGGQAGARCGSERGTGEEGGTGEGGLWRGPVTALVRLRKEDEERRVRRRDAVFRSEGRQFRDDGGIRAGASGFQERVDSREDPLTLQERLDRDIR